MAPSLTHQQPGNKNTFEHQPGARAKVEEPRRQAPLFRREEHADDLGPTRKVYGFSDAEKNAEADQDRETIRQARQPLRQ